MKLIVSKKFHPGLLKEKFPSLVHFLRSCDKSFNRQHRHQNRVPHKLQKYNRPWNIRRSFVWTGPGWEFDLVKVLENEMFCLFVNFPPPLRNVPTGYSRHISRYLLPPIFQTGIALLSYFHEFRLNGEKLKHSPVHSCQILT